MIFTLLFLPQVSWGESKSSSIFDGCGVGCFISILVCPVGIESNLAIESKKEKSIYLYNSRCRIPRYTNKKWSLNLNHTNEIINTVFQIMSWITNSTARKVNSWFFHFVNIIALQNYHLHNKISRLAIAVRSSTDC